MQPVALPTREDVDLFLLIRAMKIEFCAIGTGVDLAIAQANILLAIADEIINALSGLKRCPPLIHIGHFHGISYGDAAGIRLLHPGQHVEKRGLACAIGTYYAYYGASWNDGIDIVHQQPVAMSLGHVGDLNDIFAKSWSRGNINLQILGPLFTLMGE